MRGRKLGRMPNHRKALMLNLVTSLMKYERITTTLAKAKEMRPLVEKVIHKAKQNDARTPIFLR
jgi:large subunit ribosomal protein L17